MAFASSNILSKLEKNLQYLLQCSILPAQTYLAGGTAVYLYFNHRKSIDLDFFTPTHFHPELFLSKIKDYFDEVDLELLEENSIILYLSPEKIQFSLFYFPYKQLAIEQYVYVGGSRKCPVASLYDIAAMKAVAISQRGSIKDFIDFFFILQELDLNFSGVLELVERKYELKTRYEYQLKTSFVYFDDAEAEFDQIVMLQKGCEGTHLTRKEWEAMKDFFRKFVR